ncbi:probable crossover junction endonuclease EME2 isoform X1 [Pantherophis guttatus]|uniref:Structure-specific endonuclease subunit EME2 n=1 Tax=Pantherophis guttatus TaxID=94885 RepID=A0A6P9CSQ8_PANGU|nr:probable crossover junction endonuclease EME2 isoform X1 [Pantherophis guttatus]XP_060548909.1 probable crossover junction endonuclease EME2 isoform X1 [Pantherophis guttatus]
MEGKKKTVALDGKRAITWEISDSEEDGDVKPESSTAFAIYSDVGAQGCSDKQELEPGMAKAVPLLIPLTQTVSCNSRPEKKKKKQSLEKNKTAQIKTEEKKKSMDKKEEKMKIKQQIAAEKERRKEEAAALKFLRPDQCMKQMIVCVDSGLLEHSGSDILLEVLDTLDCKYQIEHQVIPHSITWKRKVFSSMSGSDGCQEETAVEREVLLVMQPSYFLRQLSSSMQNASPDGQQSVPDLIHLCPFHNLEEPSAISYSVVVIGLDTYQWYHQLPQEEPVAGLENETSQFGPEQSMTRHEIEEALVVLQLQGNINVLFLETWQELAQHVSAVTRAIAQRPYKKHQEKQPFSFCAKGKWASGVHIGKDGKGLQETWLKQIQQLNRVSPAMATAIAQAYPSPSLLLRAYQECKTEAERRLLLSNLQVRTEDSKTERRIGPDLSRRVYLFMVSTNPELVLDLSC